ncbi:WD40/YVTN repeat-like-containing domain,WD40-repeat-containing domain,WD40 repeat [Cinara cedri]|uniref:WD40/YVTN repeat-like-containing domain,WD40-repeat-containing domain,WD40 repeat n=1 Tax=Cinara cedri TaxID=506608 RepID=A0A5E4ML93_9HEMI|nr:WD40/YVTN repeat-like-containing domain,WD40-repeat-containing domain,WD40 repeat [Cinara cedri]
MIGSCGLIGISSAKLYCEKLLNSSNLCRIHQYLRIINNSRSYVRYVYAEMIYVEEKKIFIGGTVSAVTNNVSVNVSKHQKLPHDFTVIDRQIVRIVGTGDRMDATVSQTYLDTKSDVTQVLWCTLGYINCLVVTSSEGVIIYDCDQQFKRIFFHNCEDKNMKEKYAKGIATFECTYLCVGNSNGTIRTFGPDEDGQVVFLDRKLIHGAPITDMSAYKQNLVSCDESGCTVLSKLDSGELMIIARSKIFEGQPCTTTEITRTGLITVGYGCGRIRIFDQTIRVANNDAEDHFPMIIQVSAHARSITSMSAAKDTDLLLTVSEDSWIRVWKLNSTTITLAYCYTKEDTLFMGCQFITRNGSKFCTTAYDSSYITCYALNQLKDM